MVHMRKVEISKIKNQSQAQEVEVLVLVSGAGAEAPRETVLQNSLQRITTRCSEEQLLTVIIAHCPRNLCPLGEIWKKNKTYIGRSQMSTLLVVQYKMFHSFQRVPQKCSHLRGLKWGMVSRTPERHHLRMLVRSHKVKCMINDLSHVWSLTTGYP